MSQQPQESPIRLLLLDDQALLRESLAHFLASEPDLAVVGHCGTPSEALEILASSPVDVVLLDFAHAVEAGGRLISTARSDGLQCRFLVVSESAGAREAAAAIQSGAAGVFLKTEATHRLVLAIRVVASGAAWLDPRIIRTLATESGARMPASHGGTGPALSDREQRVLMGILSGMTNRKIGENLGLSESSVKTAVQQLFYRTGVRTRGQLVRVALEGPQGANQTINRAAESVSNGSPGT